MIAVRCRNRDSTTYAAKLLLDHPRSGQVAGEGFMARQAVRHKEKRQTKSDGRESGPRAPKRDAKQRKDQTTGQGAESRSEGEADMPSANHSQADPR